MTAFSTPWIETLNELTAILPFGLGALVQLTRVGVETRVQIRDELTARSVRLAAVPTIETAIGGDEIPLAVCGRHPFLAESRPVVIVVAC